MDGDEHDQRINLLMKTLDERNIVLWEDRFIRGFLPLELVSEKRDARHAADADSVVRRHSHLEVKLECRLRRFLKCGCTHHMSTYIHNDGSVFTTAASPGPASDDVPLPDDGGQAAVAPSDLQATEEKGQQQQHQHQHQQLADSTGESAGTGGTFGPAVPQHSEENNASPLRNRLRELRTKKLELASQLQQTAEENSRREASIQSVLNAHGHRAAQEVVRPKYVFPDTNCFLDSLSRMQELVLAEAFHIMVPIIVVNELYGLAKGNSGDAAAAARADMASNATAFLEAQFAAKARKLQAITGLGTPMRTIQFRSEDANRDRDTSNDDVILQSCTEFVKRSAAVALDDRGRKVHLIALLTGDRNLRLKAHTMDIPTLSFDDFYQLACPPRIF